MDSIKRRFFGRKMLLTEIVEGALAPQPADFALIAPKFCGRSRIFDFLASDDGPLLGAQYSDMRPMRFRDGNRVVVALLDCNWPPAQANLLEFIASYLISRLRTSEGFPLDWQLITEQTSPARQLWQLANQLNNLDYRLIVLLNNFDSVLLEHRLSQDELNELRPLTRELVLMIGTRQPLVDLDKTLAASPLFNVMTQLFVGLLEPRAAEEWIEAYCSRFPDIVPIKQRLLEATGQHPYLLTRVGDILTEIQRMKPGGQAPGTEDMALIELRLAEHGRLLFESMRQMLDSPPDRVAPHAVKGLVERLLDGFISPANLSTDEGIALNWLINQAVVRYDSAGYRLFSLLFEQFLRAQPFQDASADSAVETHDNAVRTSLDEAAPHQLPRKEADLLAYFQAHSNQVISAQQLLVDVWHLSADTSERRVQEAIRRLRLYLRDGVDMGDIKNERGHGYRFVPATRTS